MIMSWYVIAIAFVTCMTMVASDRKGLLPSLEKVKLDEKDPGTLKFIHRLESLYHNHFGDKEFKSITKKEDPNGSGVVYEFEYSDGDAICKLNMRTKGEHAPLELHGPACFKPVVVSKS